MRSTRPKPVVWSRETRQRFVDTVKLLQEQGVPPIDGAYPVRAAKPVVDFVFVRPAKTREQRKAAREAAARGEFCGFISVEALAGAA